ncbi:MAG: DNA-binding protein [Thermoproteota archaeon]|nr:MAG: DNA-binding protein [Candidatus Korarchaeota archaeon]RLG49397.1 MAG: DNA-binding protein [Candidatus Korarchaeota archaeon]RLG53678.1 MAG: DNA-binding protein [Candidatus Korarchaeota archaeon]
MTSETLPGLLSSVKDVIFVRLEDGDEIIAKLTEVAEKRDIKGAFVMGIGGIRRAKVGVFVPEKGEYEPEEVEGFSELASLLGNISILPDGKPFPHLHVVLGTKKGIVAGHLLEAEVQVTAEIFITTLSKKLSRELVNRYGLKLIKDR